MALLPSVGGVLSKGASALRDLYSNHDPLASLNSDASSAIRGDNANALVFPHDELIDIDHWATFRAFETRQASNKDRVNRTELISITLPVPGNLSTQYDIGYNDTDMGAFRSIAMDALSGDSAAAAIAQEAISTAGAGAAIGAGVSMIAGGDPFSGAAAGIFGSTIGGTVAGQRGSTSVTVAAGAEAIRNNETLAAAAGQFGIAANPHKVLLFHGVGFRTHQFTYQFSPKSFEEADILRQIIRAFKLHSSPSYDSGDLNVQTSAIPGLGLNDINIDTSVGRHFFKYPDYFEVEFKNNEFLFGIGPSVIESFHVDYHPVGIPTYSRSKGRPPTPTQINISMTLRETEIVTKENIRSENR